MRPLRHLITALLLTLASTLPARTQVLYGRVTDAADGSPVSGAQVTALGAEGATVASAVSGADGRYELVLPAAGGVRLRVSRLGFRIGISPAVTVGEGERMGVDLALRQDALRLEAVEATARTTPPFRDPRALGFFERMDRGRGRYYTPEQIIRLNRNRTSELITTYAGISMSRGRVWMGGNARGCFPTVYIDGFRKPHDISLDDLITPDRIWGIEIYRYSFDIPNNLPRDGMGSTCGIIMIWTRNS
jgi:Carboxypeptidase regulatory-like domain